MSSLESLEALLDEPNQATSLISRRAKQGSAWHGHIAFAHWLIPVIRPRVVVELGTFAAVSYAAFCNAVAAYNLETRCFAVDTWLGDAHAGSYGEDIFADVERFNSKNFGSFSHLLRCEFDAALNHFEDGSVDLLHVDGLHTYEAVRHDFETWLPKLSDRAVVLFHDTAVTSGSFGVWRYWAEIRAGYPSFEHHHSAGLGVLLVGLRVNPTLVALCATDRTKQGDQIRGRFERYSNIAHSRSAVNEDAEATQEILYDLDAQIGRVTDEGVMHNWSRSEIGPWFGRIPREAAFAAAYADLNSTDVNTFIFQIERGDVEFWDKPKLETRSNYQYALERAQGYQSWFRAVAKEHLPDASIRFALHVGDSAPENPQVPIFCFQKPMGSHCLLVPDPDILGREFPVANDTRRFAEKECRAVFAGATSGGLITSEALLADGAIPRVRAALHFRDDPDVDFRLPVICQYDNEQTADILRQMGFGTNDILDFDQQLKNKFVLSMDGNGASCTRVSIVMSSNSVLLKFKSDSQLCYFYGLQPWVNYVPVKSYGDVSAIIAKERRHPGTFGYISDNAKRFASRFLTRAALSRYTSMLLQSYAELLTEREPDATLLPRFRVMAHIENTGDRWADPGEWAGLPASGMSVQGLRVEVLDGGLPVSIRCQVITQENVLSAPVGPDVFCGTQGLSRPLLGFCVNLDATKDLGLALRCWARFVDGTIIGPVLGGTICRASTFSSLEALKIEATKV